MRWRYWIGGALAILVALYAIAWFVVSNRMQTVITDWIEDSAQKGIEIRYAGMNRGGFPFAVRWSLAEPHLASRWARGPVALSATSVTLGIEARDPSQILIRALRPHLTGEDGPTAKHWAVTADTFSATLAPEAMSESRPVVDVTYEMRALRIDQTDPSGGATPARHIGSARQALGTLRLARGPAPDGGSSKTLAIHAATADLQGVSSPRLEDLPMEGEGRIRVSAALHGGLSQGRLADLVDWRDRGGIIDLRSIDIDWQPFELRLDGTVALDLELRPIGAGTVDLRGLELLIDRQVARGALEASEASVAKLALALMTRPAKDGGEPVIRLPLTAQDGKLRAGPFTIARLRPFVR